MEEIRKETVQLNENQMARSDVVIAPPAPAPPPPPQSSCASISDFLIEYDVSSSVQQSQISSELKLQNEIERYLGEVKNQNICAGLKDFPTIAKLFYKYNCIRSTEAICERLFSYAGEPTIDVPIIFDSFCFVLFCLNVFVNGIFFQLAFVAGWLAGSGPHGFFILYNGIMAMDFNTI